MRLRYTLTALRQIEQALSYVEAHSPQGAAAIRSRILAAAALIEQHPHAGQATNLHGKRRIVLSPCPYVLFYRVAGADIVVTRFRHAARKPLPGSGPP